MVKMTIWDAVAASHVIHFVNATCKARKVGEKEQPEQLRQQAASAAVSIHANGWSLNKVTCVVSRRHYRRATAAAVVHKSEETK